jgi:hypothetical protein
MNNLLSLPEKPEFVLAGGMTPARKAYYVTAALSLASRVGEDKEKTERKFGGRTEESMPKSLKDKAPACVTEAFFEIDCAALALRDAEEDSALIGTAAPVEEASKIRTLHQLLDRSLLVSLPFVCVVGSGSALSLLRHRVTDRQRSRSCEEGVCRWT